MTPRPPPVELRLPLVSVKRARGAGSDRREGGGGQPPHVGDVSSLVYQPKRAHDCRRAETGVPRHSQLEPVAGLAARSREAEGNVRSSLKTASL